MIDAATRDFLESFFKKTAAKQEVQIVELAMLKTHVHMVVRTPPRLDLPRLVQFFKGGSSYAASRLPDNKRGDRCVHRLKPALGQHCPEGQRPPSTPFRV